MEPFGNTKSMMGSNVDYGGRKGRLVTEYVAVHLQILDWTGPREESA